MLQSTTNLLDTGSSFPLPRESKRLSSHTMFVLLAPSLSTLYEPFLKFLTTLASLSGESSTTEQATTSTPPTVQEPPPAILIPKIHPLEPQVTAEVEAYFIEHWPFPNDRAVQKFRDAGFSYVTCCYYPEALPDRIHFGCRLLTLLFLIDGNDTSIFLRTEPLTKSQTSSSTCPSNPARRTTTS